MIKVINVSNTNVNVPVPSLSTTPQQPLPLRRSKRTIKVPDKLNL